MTVGDATRTRLVGGAPPEHTTRRADQDRCRPGNGRGPRRPPPARRRRLTLAIGVAGALAGAAAKVADASSLQWAANLGHHPAVWLLVVALLGRTAPTPVWAAVRAAVFFAAMTLAYYGWAQVVLGSGPGVWRLALWWWAASASAVPAYAVLVHAASLTRGRLAGPVAGAVLALAAGFALQDGTLVELLRTWVDTEVQVTGGGRPVQAVASALTAVVVAGVLPARTRTRGWALALLVPASWLAVGVLDEAYRRGVLPG